MHCAENVAQDILGKDYMGIMRCVHVGCEVLCCENGDVRAPAVQKVSEVTDYKLVQLEGGIGEWLVTYGRLKLWFEW